MIKLIDLNRSLNLSSFIVSAFLLSMGSLSSPAVESRKRDIFSFVLTISSCSRKVQ